MAELAGPAGPCPSCGHPVLEFHVEAEEVLPGLMACARGGGPGPACRSLGPVTLRFRHCRLCAPPRPAAPAGDPCCLEWQRDRAIVAAAGEPPSAPERPIRGR